MKPSQLTETMKKQVLLFLILAIASGVIYPLVVTIIAQTFNQFQANGSLLKNTEGKVIGSKLIGQNFENASLFVSRPSATTGGPYNALASGGSNIGPSNPLLELRVSSREKKLAEIGVTSLPSDLVFASASGLDPHITLKTALSQVQRVALQNALSEKTVEKMVYSHSEGPSFGFLDDERVNVLELNLEVISAQKTRK